MKTELLKAYELERAKEILCQGGIVAFPTETVYGLGVICDDEEAFKKLVKAKSRPSTKPFTLMCAEKAQIEKYAEIDGKISKIIDTFMPGELTLLLKPKPNIPSWINLGTDKIGVRIPNHKLALELIQKVGRPMLVPSANPSDLKPALDSQHVLEYFDQKIEGVILGESGRHQPSTIVDLTNGVVKIIREGNILLEDILRVMEE